MQCFVWVVCCLQVYAVFCVSHWLFGVKQLLFHFTCMVAYVFVHRISHLCNFLALMHCTYLMHAVLQILSHHAIAGIYIVYIFENV